MLAAPTTFTVRFKVTLSDVESAEAFSEDKQAALKAALVASLQVDEDKVECVHVLVHDVLTPGDMVRLRTAFDDEGGTEPVYWAVDDRVNGQSLVKGLQGQQKKRPPRTHGGLQPQKPKVHDH